MGAFFNHVIAWIGHTWRSGTTGKIIIGVLALFACGICGSLVRRPQTAQNTIQTPAAAIGTNPTVPSATTAIPADSTVTLMPTAAEATAIPAPTIAAIPVPETHAGLLSLVLQPGDLPGEWAFKKDWVYDSAGADYEGPQPVAIANVSIENTLDPRNELGDVEIYLLETREQAHDQWRLESSQRRRFAGPGVKPYEPDYGDNAVFVPADDVVVLHTVAFQRCRALVFMFMTGTEEEVNAYAARLDKRLEPTACKDR